MIRVAWNGTPVPKPDPKCYGRGGKHKLTIPESEAYTAWRKACKRAGQAITEREAFGQSPVCMEVVFTMPFPQSLNPARRVWPAVRVGDVDKLERLLLDAFTDAGVWADDSVVVDLHGVKVYPHSPHPDARPHPGAVVRIWTPDTAPLPHTND